MPAVNFIAAYNMKILKLTFSLVKSSHLTDGAKKFL